MDLTKYRKQFISAAQTHIVTIQAQLGEIRNDLANHTVLSEMYISLHSLKGEAYAVDYKHVGELVSVLEQYLRELTDAKHDFPIERFPAFAYGVAMVASAIEKLEKHNHEPELEGIITTLKEQLGV